MEKNHLYSNKLIDETSPYLLQHAHNPVQWFPWGKEAIQKARDENKPLLISIGYSACHWCHVMERECFEDDAVAALMNRFFVCIKIDREERPDIDQVYMSAVQLMSLRGGWPLHCFALPDGKPFYGGTYFPKENWMDILEKIHREYTLNHQRVKEYADKLSEGVHLSELVKPNVDPPEFSMSLLDKTVNTWKKHFDFNEGGPDRAPKFPLPNNYQFLLRYGHIRNDKNLLDYVHLTLRKMAMGGIYDQLGGGFARYSVDAQWKVPHFEKMLYDNAQLVSLYAEAYQHSRNPLYKEVVYDTLDFILREMTSSEGAFYSALDADSEGKEGKYYVWTENELKYLLKQDFEIIKEYFNINSSGYWEEGNYILLKEKTVEEIAAANNISVKEVNEKISLAKSTLLKHRSQRIRPALDDKCLTSWNSLMLKGFTDAYRVFGEEEFLRAALKNGAFILKHQKKNDGGLFHSYKNGKSTINGFLEDYCFTIEAFVALYEVTFDTYWIQQAAELTEYCFRHFSDESTGLFFFTSDEDEKLITRKTEIHDNVIPASNSAMAKNLFLLGEICSNTKYSETSVRMINNLVNFISSYGSSYSNWGQLYLWLSNPFHTIAICGEEAHMKRKELENLYLPGKIIAGTSRDGELFQDIPLLKNKFAEGKTLIYVCRNKTCLMPVSTVEDALKQL